MFKEWVRRKDVHYTDGNGGVITVPRRCANCGTPMIKAVLKGVIDMVEEKTKVKEEEVREVQAAEVEIHDETTVSVGAEFFSKCFELMIAFSPIELTIEV